MIRGRDRSGGYTIVETMIFLAVTGALFISAMTFVTGQRQKTEFSQGVRDFASELQTIASNVSTGYTAFPFQTGQYCWTNGSAIHVATTYAGYDHCIFVGRAIQFAPNGKTDTYKVYTVVGKQHSSATKEVTSLSEAQPLALSPGTSFNAAGTEYAAEVKTFSGSLDVKWVKYGTSSVTTNTTALGFFTTFASYSGNTLTSSSIHVDTLPITDNTLAFADSSPTFVNKLDGFLRSAAAATAASQHVITVCLESGGTNQHAEVGLGSTTNDSLQVTTNILAGLCP